jgi:hypothetical protein
MGAVMAVPSQKGKRAKSWGQIEPLQLLCQEGRLFEVQEWIAKGGPVNVPAQEPVKRVYPSPLQIAIRAGFHSLAKLLLQAGAFFESDLWDSPLRLALKQRRLDLAQLLVEYGLQVSEVDMCDVFDTWQPAIMEYFIEHGACPEKNNALAYAFCRRIRTALRILKKYEDRFPSFPLQVNIALRYHAYRGSQKWVSLMLWAGGDPYDCGPGSYEESADDALEYTAIEKAAAGRHINVLKILIKKRFDPDNHAIYRALMWGTANFGTEFTHLLIQRGINPRNHPKWSSDLIGNQLNQLNWVGGALFMREEKRNLDTEDARNIMMNIHLLAKHGAKWSPDSYHISSVRRTLLKMAADYTVETVWIMTKYHVCSPEVLRVLLRTPTIRAHTYEHSLRMHRLIDGMEAATSSTTARN